MASISAECPICFERYSGPIFLCETGHSICGQCTAQVTQCPTCRAPMTKGRNFTLEAILLESAQSSTSRNFKCSFKECRMKFQNQDGLKSHQKDCEFRDVICGSCNKSIPYGDYIYHLIQVHKVQEKSTGIHIPFNLDKIKSKDGDKYILYNENGDNLLVNMMVQNGLFYIWIEHLKSNSSSSGIGGKYMVQFWRNGQTSFSLSMECPVLGFRSTLKIEILEHYFPISLKQLENFQRTGTSITSIMISSDATNNIVFHECSIESRAIFEEGASGPTELNLDEVEIKDADFRLNRYNVEVLSSLKENYTVKDLNVRDISVKKIPEILKKFKAIQKLFFWHTMDTFGNCVYFNSFGGDGTEDCIFKLSEINSCGNLKELIIQNLEIHIGDAKVGLKNLPNLKKLTIFSSNILGNLVDTIATSRFALEEIFLRGNTPLLEREDVETLLRIKSLKDIYLAKYRNRQVISGSFAPIGPDGKLFAKITQNAEIEFKRDSNCKPWKLTRNN